MQRKPTDLSRMLGLAEFQRFAAGMNPQLGLKDMLQSFLERTISFVEGIRRLSGTNGHIQEVDRRTGKLRILAHVGVKIFEDFEVGKQGITGWVADTGIPLCLGNTEVVPWNGVYIALIPNMKSELAVPIRVPENPKPIGIINLESNTENAFSKEDQLMLEELADISAAAIRSARQHEHFSAINDINTKLVGGSSLDEVMQHIVEKSALSTDAFYACIRRVVDKGPSRRTLVRLFKFGDESSLAAEGLACEDNLMAYVVQKKEPVNLRTLYREREYRPYSYVRHNPKTRSQVILPIIWKDEVWGIMNLEYAVEYACDDHDLTFLVQITEQVKTALELDAHK